MAKDLIEAAMVKLVHEQPFFANLLMNMTRNYTTDIPTLGVNVTDNVNLYINPFFWQNLTLDEQVAILIHEAYHVINNHFGRFADLEPELYEKKDKSLFDKLVDQQNASMLNYAGDYAINEIIPNLPKKITMFDKEGKVIVEPAEIDDGKGNKIPNPNAGKPAEGRLLFVDDLRKTNPKIEKLKNLEYYYDYLKDDQQKNGKKVYVGGSGTMTLDDHSIWKDGNSDVEYVTEKVKQTVNKAVEQSGGLSAGNIPSDVREAVHFLNHKPRDWKKELNSAICNSIETLVESSRKTRNRRYGILFAGQKTFSKLHVVVCCDSSGSMQGEPLNQVGAELVRISQHPNVNITVIEGDCQVQSVYEFDVKRFKEMKGMGGTAFGPSLAHADSLKADLIIYLTDGDTSDNPPKPKTPLIWGIVGSQKPPLPYGRHIKIDIQKKK